MHYTVHPGLYAVGEPTGESAVLVGANYKMSFDHLRSRLGGLNAWIMVLDTRGINVWCAAGKGTFGTDEIVSRIAAVRLAEVVSHRTLILPQLGAPGVSAHEVRRRSGFRIVYGPVRAKDLPAFLAAGMKASLEMRRVRFDFLDRVVLIPVELTMAAKYAVLIAAAFLVLAGFGPAGYSLARASSVGSRAAVLLLGTCLAAVTLTPALLPWLPGRAFSLKGAWIGLAIVLAVGGYTWHRPALFENRLTEAAWFLMIPALASFLAMNFTGSSTYTSLSGVRREMRVAVPIQLICAVAGVCLWLIGRFF
jgi:acetyl-CoA decarbonylase/synthase complex subunit gamma